MSRLRNRVTLIGRLGQDPEVTTFDSGKQKVSMNVATTESYKNAKGEKQEETQWHRAVIWSKLGDVAKNYLKKGNEVALEGKVVYRDYQDKEGVSRKTTEIVVDEMVLIGGKAS